MNLVDFGISCRVSNEYSRFLNKIVGTPGYIDPTLLLTIKERTKVTELLKRDQIFKTDLFSIGATFSYLATGWQMISGQNNKQVF